MAAALEGVSGQQHALTTLYPRGRPGTNFTVGWVGPRAGLDGRKISSPQGLDPGPSSLLSVAIPTELPGPLFIRHGWRKWNESCHKILFQSDRNTSTGALPLRLLGSPHLHVLYVQQKNRRSLGILPCTAQNEHVLSNNDNQRHSCDVTTYLLSPISYQVIKILLKIFIQENAADLQNWVQSLDTRDDSRRKTYRSCLYHCVTFFPLATIR